MVTTAPVTVRLTTSLSHLAALIDETQHRSDVGAAYQQGLKYLSDRDQEGLSLPAKAKLLPKRSTSSMATW